MFATANWCLAVVQGTVRSWLPLGLSSPAIRPMANAGACPKFLRWGHAGPLIESSLAFCALWLETSLHRLWRSIMRLLASNRVRGEFGRTREVSLSWRRLSIHATRSTAYIS